MYFILFYTLTPTGIILFYRLLDGLPFWATATLSPLLSALIVSILLCLSVILMGPIMKRLPIDSKFKKWYCVQVLKFGSNVIGLDVSIVGKENIPDKAPYVTYGNHKSYTDVMLTYVIFPHPMSFVGKKEAWKIPIIKNYLSALGAVPIDRKNDRTTAIAMVQAIKLAKSGLVMGIFPEGGIKDRNDPKMVGVKAGAYKLAQKAEVPILPFSINGSTNVRKRAPWFKTKLVFTIHKPILYEAYKDMNTMEIGKKVFDIVNSVL